MAGFLDYQVLYTDTLPTTPIRLGQLVVDESEAAPLDMLKFCDDLSPLSYTSFSDAIVALMPVGANPTASVGLTAVNGTALTFMRSDAAPPLSQAIVPTWSGVHTWSAQARFASGTEAAPGISFDADQDCGFHRPAGNQVTLSLGGADTVEFVSGGIPVRITGTSDATQPSCRFAHYTTDFATERGYWGYPTSTTDGMIMRNIVGDTIQLRTSSNTTVIEAGTDYAEFAAAIVESGVISPAQLTANTDNWNPTGIGSASVIRLSTDASRNITGIVAQNDGTRILLCNVGAQNAVLVHDLTSTAANRFLCPGSANFTLNANDAVYIWYDTVSNRWRVVAF
jgi:hypothetical protein